VVGAASAVRLLTRVVGWDQWGGLMLNLFLAIAGITLCFPLGVLLALGRRAGRPVNSPVGGVITAVVVALPFLVIAINRGLDFSDWWTWILLVLAVALGAIGFITGRRTSLPLLRLVSTGYIELIRGMPLFVLLLIGFASLVFFLPVSMSAPGLVVRAIVVLTLFTAAYIAEIVRGGLQSLPKGQTEAAQALGLSPLKTTGLIVMPQALRNVIPSIVGQFISLFKDTTLAGAAMGFAEMLNVRETAQAQEAFRGARLIPETVTFVMFVFWIGCITMSRESQRLERKLGVGTR
jgi:general L-amino acid transport system permease protein